MVHAPYPVGVSVKLPRANISIVISARPLDAQFLEIFSSDGSRVFFEIPLKFFQAQVEGAATFLRTRNFHPNSFLLRVSSGRSRMWPCEQIPPNSGADISLQQKIAAGNLPSGRNPGSESLARWPLRAIRPNQYDRPLTLPAGFACYCYVSAGAAPRSALKAEQNLQNRRPTLTWVVATGTLLFFFSFPDYSVCPECFGGPSVLKIKSTKNLKTHHIIELDDGVMLPAKSLEPPPGRP